METRTKKDAEDLLASKKSVLSYVSDQLQLLKQTREATTQSITAHQGALNLLKVCLDACITSKDQIEGLVQAALQDVFEQEYLFKLEPIQEEGVTKGINPLFITPGGVICDPYDDSGAALISVGGLFLLIAILLVSNKTKPLLVLDEYLTTVKTERWERVGRILENLVRETPLRIIFFTHSTRPLGTLYSVEMKNGISRVAKVQD